MNQLILMTNHDNQDAVFSLLSHSLALSLFLSFFFSLSLYMFIYLSLSLALTHTHTHTHKHTHTHTHTHTQSILPECVNIRACTSMCLRVFVSLCACVCVRSEERRVERECR